MQKPIKIAFKKERQKQIPIQPAIIAVEVLWHKKKNHDNFSLFRRAYCWLFSRSNR